MKATLHGMIAAPAAVVVGAWDPMVRAHLELFEQLSCHASENRLSSVVVVIDPDPAIVMRGRAKWQVYDDLHARVQYIRHAGANAVLHLHFTERDLEAGAAEFFDKLEEYAPIRELWLGAHQSLGRGPAGSNNAIVELAEERGVYVHRLPIVRYTPAPYDIRQGLLAGRLEDVVREMGRPPVRKRPRSGTLRLAWAPGRYRAIPLAHPTGAPIGPAIDVDVAPILKGFRMPRLLWPDSSIRYLAFISGPGDSGEAFGQERVSNIA